MYKIFSIIFFFTASVSFAQEKKPLTHAVYDGWKSVGERMISKDGNFIIYAINPQEGDGELVIQNLKTNYKLYVSRGYNAVISEDSKYAIFKIKPLFQDTRQAKIKKKKPDEMPKDSLAIIQLGLDSIIKISRVKSFKTPEKAGGWVAYQLEKPLPDSLKRKLLPDSIKAKIDMLTRLADSLIRKSLDSVKGKIQKEEVISAAQKAVKEIYKKADDFNIEKYFSDAEGDESPGAGGNIEGTELIVRNVQAGSMRPFKLVSEYLFDKKGTRLLIETSKNSKDTNSKAYVLLYNLAQNKVDTLLTRFNDVKSFVFDEAGAQLAFVAERDSTAKSLQKFYKLWYYTLGKDSAYMITDKNTVGMRLGSAVSENGTLKFSRDGEKLFFGVAPVQPAKDTSLVGVWLPNFLPSSTPG